jgi:hypothetical protein
MVEQSMGYKQCDAIRICGATPAESPVRSIAGVGTKDSTPDEGKNLAEKIGKAATLVML